MTLTDVAVAHHLNGDVDHDLDADDVAIAPTISNQSRPRIPVETCIRVSRISSGLPGGRDRLIPVSSTSNPSPGRRRTPTGDPHAPEWKEAP